jgi:hypothetical protein
MQREAYKLFRTINLPCFSPVFLSSPTSYRMIRRGRRLALSPTNNMHK